jgi:hypothetical protein
MELPTTVITAAIQSNNLFNKGIRIVEVIMEIASFRRDP